MKECISKENILYELIGDIREYVGQKYDLVRVSNVPRHYEAVRVKRWMKKKKFLKDEYEYVEPNNNDMWYDHGIYIDCDEKKLYVKFESYYEMAKDIGNKFKFKELVKCW